MSNKPQGFYFEEDLERFKAQDPSPKVTSTEEQLELDTVNLASAHTHNPSYWSTSRGIVLLTLIYSLALWGIIALLSDSYEWVLVFFAMASPAYFVLFAGWIVLTIAAALKNKS